MCSNAWNKTLAQLTKAVLRQTHDVRNEVEAELVQPERGESCVEKELAPAFERRTRTAEGTK